MLLKFIWLFIKFPLWKKGGIRFVLSETWGGKYKMKCTVIIDVNGELSP